MNDQDLKNNLLDYAYGELSSEQAHQLEAALEDAPEAREELRRLRTLRGLVSQALPQEEVPHLVRANILREARKHAELRAAEQQPLWERVQGWLFHPSFAVAAMAVLVIGVAVVVAQRNDSPQNEAAPGMAAAEAPARETEGGAAPAAAAPVYDPQAVEGTPNVAMAEPEPAPEEALPGAGAPIAPLQDAVVDAEAPRREAPPTDAKEEAEKQPLEEELARAVPPQRDDVQLNSDNAKGNLPQQQADPTPWASNAVGKSLGSKTAVFGDGESEGDGAEVASDNRSAAPEVAEGRVQNASPPPSVAAAKPAAKQEAAADLDDAPQQERSGSISQSARNATRAGGADSVASGGLSGSGQGRSIYGGGSIGGSAGPGQNSYNDRYNLSAAEGKADKNLESQKLNADESVAAKGKDAAPTPWDLQRAEEAYNRALLRQNRGDYSGASDAFNEVVQNAPRGSTYHMQALFSRGTSQQRLSNQAAAAESFRALLAQYPNSPRADEARFYLAKALLAQDSTSAEARQLLDGLRRGGGGGTVAQQAEETWNRSFGRDDRKPAKAAPSKARSKKSSYDYEEAAPRPAESLETF